MARAWMLAAVLCLVNCGGAGGGGVVYGPPPPGR